MKKVMSKPGAGGHVQAAFEALFLHLTLMGDYKLCAVSDDILLEKAIFVGSRLPKDCLPLDVDLVTREASADASSKLIPDKSTRTEFKLDVPLTQKQHTMLINKMIKSHEGNIAGLLSDEAKVRQRPSLTDWVSARIVVQMWDESVEECARKDLSAADFVQLEKIVLETLDLDAELLSARKRWPKWFHMGLLPNLVSDEKPDVDANVRFLSEAQRQAEVSALHAFELELSEDWLSITTASNGITALREYMTWRSNQHRRDQMQLAEGLVTTFVDKYFPLLEGPAWNSITGAVSIFRQHLLGTTQIGEAGLQCKTILLMDFNCPGARDVLRMGQMHQAAATMCKMLGPQNCILFAVMPNCSKEDSETSAFEDEVMIANSLKRAGFGKQIRVRMLLDMPVSLAQRVHAIDWFVDIRLCVLEVEETKEGNFWEMSSELSRTRIVREIPCVPESGELVDATSLSADEDLNTGVRYMDVTDKCAQRGLAAYKAQLKSLLTPSARLTSKADWLGNQTIMVVDFQAHIGDRAMAVYELRKELNLPGLCYVNLAVGQGQHQRHALYSATRIRNRVTDDWMQSKLVLTKEKLLPSGQTVQEEVRPTEEPPEPTEAELAQIPGALVAYRGLGKLSFRVCVTQGNKITIRPDKLAQFATCSPDTAGKIKAITERHEAQYMRALSDMDAGAGKSEAPVLLNDGRNLNPEPPTEGESIPLMEFESLEALRAVTTISGECRAVGKNLFLYRDEAKKMAYILCKTENTILARGTPLGAIGGGSIIDADEDRNKAVPWDLPLGDQTWVQLESKKADRNAEDEEVPKFASGTLYAIARQIESKSTKGLKITSFGDLLPVTESGLQKYTFSTPKGAENHRKLDYVMSTPKPGAKVSHGNFFAPFVDRSTGLGNGPVQLTWRLTHDAVGNCLKVQRVAVTVAKRIELVKGKPVRILWPTDAAA